MPVAVGRWYKVKWLVEYFVAHGCRYGQLPDEVETPYGMRTIRFIVDPTGAKFVTLSDLEDDESVSESIFGGWELILGIEVTKNGTPC
jgi:hypothetical protein